MATLDRLYTLYDVIADAKDTAGEHEAEFAEILTGVKGGPGERRLTSQFIARFFQHFPVHQEQALNALFDLCEDDDVTIRKQAIKDLPSLCRGRTELVPKVADILAQLLQMEDMAELATVQSSLVSLLKTDTKGTLTGLFYQIEHSEDEVVRERCIRFLHTKIRSLGSQVFTSEVETLILSEAKKVLQVASSEEEFTLMMGILRELKSCQTVKGYQQLVDLVAEQVDFGRPLDPSDLESVHRLISCTKQALPYFSSQVRSTQFVEYMWREVVPALDHLEAALTDSGNSAALILDLLKIIAELVPHAGNIDDVGAKVMAIYDKLLDVMPLPPEGDAATEALEGGVSLEFSRVECLLYSFHQLAKHNTEFLSEDPDRLKDFRISISDASHKGMTTAKVFIEHFKGLLDVLDDMVLDFGNLERDGVWSEIRDEWFGERRGDSEGPVLQYFARVSQAYQKRLREAIANKTGEELKTEENKIKLIALKTTANINILIKDLFHQPPSYKASIALSWKPASAAGRTIANGTEKRHTPITFDSSNPKSHKGERQIYAPPRDKYSQRAGQYSGGTFRGRGRGRGRGFGYAFSRGSIFRSGFRGRRGNFRAY